MVSNMKVGDGFYDPPKSSVDTKLAVSRYPVSIGVAVFCLFVVIAYLWEVGISYGIGKLPAGLLSSFLTSSILIILLHILSAAFSLPINLIINQSFKVNLFRVLTVAYYIALVLGITALGIELTGYIGENA